MDCADFDKRFDLYVDDELAPADMDAAREHIGACKACEQSVTRFQQTRALLSTAVAEVAAAVDVSGLWADVESALDPPCEEPERALVVDSWPSRARRWLAESFDGGPLGYAWRVGMWGGASALAAAALVLTVSGLEPQRVEVAQTPTVKTSTLAATRTSPGARTSPAVQTSPASRRVARVRLDSLETAPGHSVSTWVLPRSKARVIWVSKRDSATVQQVSYDK